MPDEFKDLIAPVSGSPRVDRLEPQAGSSPPVRAMQSIAGRVVSVHRRSQHREGQHALDVSVGGEEYTELVLRVPSGAYANLEGKRVVIFIEE